MCGIIFITRELLDSLSKKRRAFKESFKVY